MPLPIRGQLLNNARDLTLGDRNKAYGDPLTNLNATGALKREFWNAARLMGDAPYSAIMEQNTAWGCAIDMVLVKLARIASAPTLSGVLLEDSYKDAAAYLAIAFEVGQRSTSR